MSELKDRLLKWIEEQRTNIQRNKTNYDHFYNTGKWRVLDDLEEFLKTT